MTGAQKADKIQRIRENLLDKAGRCDLCPRRCGINRSAGERGYCQAPGYLNVASTCLHRGEEPFLSGTRGSGTIFFTHCALRCVFCQNFQISHEGLGQRMEARELAERMLGLQRRGAHNINLVSPTPYLPWILESLEIACRNGLTLPLVYNTHGYESVEIIEKLEGIVDIYLPDLKYADPKIAARYSGAEDYPEIGAMAVKTMYEQAGPLRTDADDIAVSGIIVRHLALPGHIQNSLDALDFLAHLDRELVVAIMGQYFPTHKSQTLRPIDRRLTQEEYDVILDHAIDLGLENSLIQELDSAECYVPDFTQEHPFESSEQGHTVVSENK